MHVLVLSLHHIVVDAASAAVLARDLSALYRAELDGTPPGLPELTHGPADHARRHLASSLEHPKAAEDLKYWLDALGGDLPVLELPLDRPRPATMTARGRAVFHTLDRELSDRLRKFSARRRGTLFMTLLAGYAATLHRITGQEDIVVGTPISRRPPGTENLLGFFVNTLALRLDLSGDPGFDTLLGRVRRVALDAYDHADVPFETVVRELAPRRATDRTPVFQTLAEFEREDPFRFELPGVRATPLDAGPDKSLTDLSVYFTDTPDGVRCHLEYATDLFDAATVDRLFDTFHTLLRAALDAPATPLSRLVEPSDHGGPVPPEWSHGPVRPVAPVTVQQLVARQAATAPDRTAVICGDTRLTYGELTARAGRLAAAIRERAGEPRPDDVVALWLPRSADLVVAMLAALEAGRGYLPLDPSLGPARARAVIAECGARTVVSHAAGAARLALPDGPAVVLVTDTARDPAGAPAAPATGPESLCYVVHTSGSTGVPKGIAVPHRAVVDLCQWQHRRFDTTPADRAAMVCSQSFDASVLEIWPALTAGASITVADDAVRADPAALARWYAAEHVTFSILPTALGEAVLALGPREQPPLRHLLLGGDVLRTRPRPGTPYQVLNVYGPSEVTVLCTTETVTPGDPGDPGGTGGPPIPIGRPVDNVSLLVLDASGAPAPVGAVGELYVGGPGLARGYPGRPELTAERFAQDPTGRTAERLYRTGDLVRWTPDGALEFRGRVDDQVKIRGYRVEPEEAGRVLNRLEAVREAVVLAHRDHRGEAYLAAYAVPVRPVRPGDERETAQRLHDELAARLPEYLVPRAWAILPALPLTGNGKLDRAALPSPALVPTPALPPAMGAQTEHGPGCGAGPGPETAMTAGTGPGAAGAVAPVAGDGGSSAERRLRALWAAEFGVPEDGIGPDTSFFDLGGHSITAIRLVNRVRETFGTDYPMARFHREPTVRAMAAYLTGAAEAEDRVVSRAPVTPQQNGFIGLHAEHPLPHVFNVALRLTLTGRLDLAALRTALSGLTARHEALRTRFRRTGGGDDGPWWQEVLAHRPVDLPVTDLSGLEPAARDAEIGRLSTEAAEHRFDLAAGVEPVARLLRTAADGWVLLLVLHHVSCDGWAVSVLLREFAALYRAAATGEPHGLDEAVPQPSRYAERQAGGPGPAVERARLDHWARRLDGVPLAADVPVDRPRPDAPSGAGDVVVFEVPAGVRAAVEALARRRGTTPFAVAAAAYGTLLARLSAQRDVVVGVPFANRRTRADEAMVTCTAAALVLRVRAGGERRFADVVDEVGREILEAADHYMPVRRITAELRARGVPGVPDRVPFGFAFQSALDTGIELPHLTVAIDDLATRAARNDLSVGLVPSGDAYAGYAEFSTDIWNRRTIESWIDQYVTLLSAATEAPDALPATHTKQKTPAQLGSL
ncbi:amino acid adenylation domain-containing protein [Streptomyces sp. URMC 123]|uniref:non-ribosomal peptide synthetase n=1 Tax=Streptomyces sp. URMC 123 TaxID=3423403 RepID=UPI003F1BA51F